LLRLIAAVEARHGHRRILVMMEEEVLDLIGLARVRDEIEKGDEHTDVLLLLGLGHFIQDLEEQLGRWPRE
jgi:hypothetical protein